MNNRPDSNTSDFDGRKAGTGANAKANQGTKLAKQSANDRRGIASQWDKSPMSTGKGQRA